MKIAIFNNHAEHSVIIAKKLILAMKKNNVDIDDRNPDIVVSVGGDGTLLGAFQSMLIKQKACVLLAFIQVIWGFIRIG